LRWASSEDEVLALVEPTLAQDLGVSRPSVREGLVRLEAEGFIRRRKGAGTVVNPGALEMLARFDQQVEFADLLRQAGFEPTVELLDAATVPLAERDAKALDRAAGTPSLRTVKRWRADGTPVMVAVDVVPAPDGDGTRLAALDPEAGLFELVRLLTGEVVEWELAWPGAEPLRGLVRRWLDSGPGGGAVLTLDLVGVSRRGARVCTTRSSTTCPAPCRPGSSAPYGADRHEKETGMTCRRSLHTLAAVVLLGTVAAACGSDNSSSSSADLGVRIGSASGYLKTSPIQRHFRDAQAGALMAYSTELCRDFLGKSVLAVAPPTHGGVG
jgi:GntR family transcriptional regulator